MDDLAEALERAAEFLWFETKQRYMRGVFAMRQEVLRLKATRESRLTANSVGGVSSTQLHHNKLRLLKGALTETPS